METITFSHNWNNKLECDVFTSIRLATGKYRLGETYSVTLKGKHCGNVKLIDVAIIRLDQLKPYIAYLDTGYDLKETKTIIQKMYPDKNWNSQLIAVLLFKRIIPRNDNTDQAKQKDATGGLFEP